jgi:hypothetical protein
MARRPSLLYATTSWVAHLGLRAGNLRSAFSWPRDFANNTACLCDFGSSLSPWYISFDHRTPRDDSTVVVSSNMINHMKADLTESEFCLTVVQLAEVFTGTRERVDTFQLSHWRRT